MCISRGPAATLPFGVSAPIVRLGCGRAGVLPRITEGIVILPWGRARGWKRKGENLSAGCIVRAWLPSRGSATTSWRAQLRKGGAAAQIVVRRSRTLARASRRRHAKLRVPAQRKPRVGGLQIVCVPRGIRGGGAWRRRGSGAPAARGGAGAGRRLDGARHGRRDDGGGIAGRASGRGSAACRWFACRGAAAGAVPGGGGALGPRPPAAARGPGGG